VNQPFYFQPRNFCFLDETEGCRERVNLRPDMRCGIGIATAIVATGLGIYAAVSSSNNASAAQKANSQAAAQATTQQIANLTSQVSADQASISAADTSKKTWEYVAVGAAVIVVFAGVVYLMKPKGK
jgi:cobalamin biosynthesis Mg chelatase CobN